MATLTSDQLTDLQGDIGISADETVFTDAALNRLFTRAASNYEKTVVLALRQILAQAAKLHSYSTAAVNEDLDQVYQHLKDQLDYWENRVVSQTQQIKIVGLRGIPPRWKDEP